MKKKQPAVASSILTDSTGLERVIFFSDAVFAIAVTLLPLKIRMPESDGLLNEEQLLHQYLCLGLWLPTRINDCSPYIKISLVCGQPKELMENKS